MAHRCTGAALGVLVAFLVDSPPASAQLPVPRLARARAGRLTPSSVARWGLEPCAGASWPVA